MLDSVFTVPPVFDESYYGFVIHEIREMTVMNMGNYAHGNQPVQHMIYLYNYAGEPWKAQYWIRQVIDRFYSPAPDGYCGDEDNGQTSAWYIFSALGFYPVCPASDQYVMGAPLFKQATIKLENGKKFTINAPENSADNLYIDNVTMKGVGCFAKVDDSLAELDIDRGRVRADSDSSYEIIQVPHYDETPKELESSVWLVRGVPTHEIDM